MRFLLDEWIHTLLVCTPCNFPLISFDLYSTLSATYELKFNFRVSRIHKRTEPGGEQLFREIKERNSWHRAITIRQRSSRLRTHFPIRKPRTKGEWKAFKGRSLSRPPPPRFRHSHPPWRLFSPPWLLRFPSGQEVAAPPWNLEPSPRIYTRAFFPGLVFSHEW